MKHQQIYMWYYKEYGCWLKNEGDCGRAMDPGESFKLCLDKRFKCSLPFRISWTAIMVCGNRTKSGEVEFAD